MKEQRPSMLWIEVECWEPGTWTPDDISSDAIVTWEDGERWVASFISYKHVQTLTEKYKRTGENCSGAYFWMSEMILVDQVSRQRIEEVIGDLLRTGDFEAAFTHLPKEEAEEAGVEVR